jgi:hypothetical protein
MLTMSLECPVPYISGIVSPEYRHLQCGMGCAYGAGTTESGFGFESAAA